MAQTRTEMVEHPGAEQDTGWGERPTEDAPSSTGDAGQEPEVLEPGSVRLSDGRLVVLMRTTGVHDLRVEKLLGRFGYSLAGMGAASYMRWRALLAMESIDGEMQWFPKNQQMLEDRLDLPTEDIEKIQRAYMRLNGLDRTEDGDSFR